MNTNRMFGIGLLAAVGLVALIGCPGATPTSPGDGSMTDGSTTDDAPTASKLFTLITETDPYEEWAQFPGLEGTIESAPPHGPMARVFINASVESALEDFSGRLPEGSIIVKESSGENAEEKANALAIMWKVSGFDPDNNDWFWANVTPEGVVTAEGRIAGCASCHSGAGDNDFIFLHQFAP